MHAMLPVSEPSAVARGEVIADAGSAALVRLRDGRTVRVGVCLEHDARVGEVAHAVEELPLGEQVLIDGAEVAELAPDRVGGAAIHDVRAAGPEDEVGPLAADVV